MQILRVEHVSKTYGKDDNRVTALQDVSLSIEKGEFVSIIGASGSGKSTLLHIIGGVDRPSSGKVIIEGKDISAYTFDQMAIFRRRQIGIVYQFYNLLPILNVEENILLPILLDQREPDKAELDKLIRKLGLEERRRHLPNQLSGGQQQKTAIGRALITHPALILADEPTGNLDSRSSDEIVSLLKRANREGGQTIIMITHNPEVAAAADRTYRIEDGRLVEEV